MNIKKELTPEKILNYIFRFSIILCSIILVNSLFSFFGQSTLLYKINFLCLGIFGITIFIPHGLDVFIVTLLLMLVYNFVFAFSGIIYFVIEMIDYLNY
jgi:hypothetical protein